MISDLAQRQRALDTGSSFIVQAPAGSGKTELLVQRFLALLGQAQCPEEIIAITFTRKAATEMRERIMLALEKSTQAEPLAAHAKTTWKLAKKVLNRDQQLQWNVLNNPHRLRIQTIDALCASLTRRLPLLSGLGGDAPILDDAQACYIEAAQRLMHDLAESQSTALTDLLLHLDNQIAQLEHLFALMLSRRDQWLPHLISHHYQYNSLEFKEKLEQALQQVVKEILQACHETFPQTLTLDLVSLLNFSCGNLASEKNNHKIGDWQNLNIFPEPQLDYLPSWQAIADFLLTSEGSWRLSINKNLGFPPGEKIFKERMIHLLQQLLAIEPLRKNLFALKQAPPIFYTNVQWQIIAALTEILPLLAAHLRLVFQERGGVDFLEISLAALQGLGEKEAPSDLALALDYQIHHILVDEFQDTSTTQFRLLEKLTHDWETQDGRSLFLVGDPMQSIYRFREAEVGLFLKAQREGIGQISLEALQLSTNFRSDPTIIAWINQHFPKLFSSSANISSGSVPYHPSTAMNDCDQHANIQFHPCFDTSEFEQEHTIIQIIQNALQKNSDESIAVLVRQRNHLQHLIPLLKAAHIQFSAVEIESIAEQSIVLDLFALTSALLNPGDHLSWFVILRSPFCGLTLADLLALVNYGSDVPLFESLKNYLQNHRLSTEGKDRLAHIMPIFLNSISQRGRCSLRQWIENTWRNLRGPNCLQNQDEQVIADTYFDLLEKWNAKSDISDFETAIRKVRISPTTVCGTKVHLMTIHKAKGLEFDRVIIPHLEGKEKTADQQLLLWLDRPRAKQENDLILAAIKSKSENQDAIYQYLRRIDQEKSRKELVRLLYVAITRTRKNLHLTASIKSKQEELCKPQSGSFLELLWDAFQGDQQLSIPKLNSRDETHELPPRSLRRLFLADLPMISTAQETQIVSPKLTVWQNQTLAPIGSIIHRYLQQMSIQGLNKWTKEKIQLLRPQWTIELLQLRVAEKEIEHCLASIETALIHCLQDNRAHWIFSQEHGEQRSEWPLTVIIDNQPKHIIIDRSFVDQNIRWIIDYKTAAAPHDSVEHFLDQQQVLYETQLNRYAQAVQALDSRPIRIGLYFPLWKGWREWAFSTI